MFFDFHHHFRGRECGIYNLDFTEEIPENYFSVGLHPNKIDENYKQNLDKIKEILDNQTSQVIQNCLVIGMKSYDPELDNQHLAIIGYKLGYLFQLLNDCEAYFNPEFTVKYKGNHNFDINKSRKNLCYVYLEQFLSNKEKLRLQNKDKVTNIEILLNKYSVLEHIKNEVSLIEFDIKKQCEVLEKNHSMERLNYFIDYSKENVEKYLTNAKVDNGVMTISLDNEALKNLKGNYSKFKSLSIELLDTDLSGSVTMEDGKPANRQIDKLKRNVLISQLDLILQLRLQWMPLIRFVIHHQVTVVLS